MSDQQPSQQLPNDRELRFPFTRGSSSTSAEPIAAVSYLRASAMLYYLAVSIPPSVLECGRRTAPRNGQDARSRELPIIPAISSTNTTTHSAIIRAQRQYR